MRKLEHAIKERKEHLDLNYESDDGEGFTDSEALEELLGECGKDASGLCSIAGSEYCDLECPFS